MPAEQHSSFFIFVWFVFLKSFLESKSIVWCICTWDESNNLILKHQQRNILLFIEHPFLILQAKIGVYLIWKVKLVFALLQIKFKSYFNIFCVVTSVCMKANKNFQIDLMGKSVCS